MRDVLEAVDRVLARIPPESISGRATRDEILDHLADSASERVAAGESMERALGDAVAAFGAAEDLERDYYRDYVASRYLWGLFDRELLWRPERLLLDVGRSLLGLGLLLYLLVPTVAKYAAGMGIGWVQVNFGGAIVAEDPGAFRDACASAVANALPWPLDSGAFGVVAAAGLVTFAAGGFWTLRRARLLAAGAVHPATALLFAVLPVAGIAFVFAARPSVYGTALEAALFDDAEATESIRDLARLTWIGTGTLVLLLTAAGVVTLAAFRRGAAGTIGLRRAGFGLAVLVLGGLWTSHPFLLGLLQDQAAEPVAPAALVAGLHSDLHRFVLGVLLMVHGVHRLHRVADDANRILASRGLVARTS